MKTRAVMIKNNKYKIKTKINIKTALFCYILSMFLYITDLCKYVKTYKL